MSKSASLFIVDLGMNQECLDQTRTILSRLLQTKLMENRSTDVVGLILVGTEASDNDLATQFDYNHVSIFGYTDNGPVPLAKTSVELFKCVHELIPGPGGDVTDGIILAMHTLTSHCKHYKFTKKIYLFTQGTGLLNDEDMDTLTEQSMTASIQYSLIGWFDEPRTEPQETLFSFVEKCQGTFYPGAEARDVMEKLQAKSVKPTTTFRENLIIGDPSAEHVSIPIWIYNKTTEAKPPSAQKFSNVARAARPDEDPRGIAFGKVKLDRSYHFVDGPKDPLAQPSSQSMPSQSMAQSAPLPSQSMALSMAQSAPLPSQSMAQSAALGSQSIAQSGSQSLSQSKSNDVDLTTLASSAKYGQIRVPFTSEDVRAATLETEKSFRVLGFIPLSKVYRDQFLKNVLAVVPASGNDLASEQLYSLLAAMEQKQVAAVCRYVRTANAAVVIGVLLRNRKGYGYFIPMPFKDDMKHYSFTDLQFLTEPESESVPTMGSISGKRAGSTTVSRSLKKNKLHKRKCEPNVAFEAIDAFMDSMDLSTADSGIEAYRLKDILNPGIQRLYQSIAARIVDPGLTTLPPMDPRIVAGIRPLPAIQKASAPLAQKLESLFGLEKVIAPEKGAGKKSWARREVPAKTTDANTLLDVDRLFDEEETIQVIEMLHPSEDFEKMVADKDGDRVDSAFEQMPKIISSLLIESRGDQFYVKTMDALQTLRQASVSMKRPDAFNVCLKDLKGRLTSGDLTRHADFWKNEILFRKFGLISKNEVGESRVSGDEASEFFYDVEVVSIPTGSLQFDDDEMDMLD